MVAYRKFQQRKKEESKRLRGERDQIKFIDLSFKRWQFVGLSKLYWERPWWHMESSKKGRKKKAKG